MGGQGPFNPIRFKGGPVTAEDLNRVQDRIKEAFGEQSVINQRTYVTAPVGSVPNQAPTSIPGTGGGPWLNGAVQYVSGSPKAKDTNDGLGWDTAKRTGYAAAAAVLTSGGGTVYMADGSSWGGPVGGQGAYLRGDGATIPGWLSTLDGSGAPIQLRVIGVGRGNSYPFTKAGAATIYAGSNVDADFRTKPAMWLVRCSTQVSFENIAFKPAPGYEGSSGEATNLQARISWDYNRNADGSLRSMVASSSARAGGLATHVVAMPAGIPVASASRSGAVVTVTLPRPAGQATFPPWRTSTTVWIQSTDAHFPSGAYQLLTCNSNVDSQTDWGFTYNDGGSGSFTTTGLTVSSPGCGVGSIIEVQGVNVEFPARTHVVTGVSVASATQATITVTDESGGASASPGYFDGPNGRIHYTVSSGNYGVTILTQERGYAACVAPNLDGFVALRNPGFSQFFTAGPTIDIGGTRAVHTHLSDSYVTGYYPDPRTTTPYLRWQHPAIVVYAYSNAGNGGLVTLRLTGVDACIAGSTNEQEGYFEIDVPVFDSGTGYPPPFADIDGGRFTIVNVRDIHVADAAVAYQEPVFNGIPPGNIRGQYRFLQRAVGPSNNYIADPVTWQVPGAFSPVVKSPWSNMNVGSWAGYASDLLVTGKHPAAWRDVSPVTPRFTNLVGDPSTWSSVPTVYATTQPTPLGRMSAIGYDGTPHGSYTGTTFSRTDSFFEVGGRLVVAAWVYIPSDRVNADWLWIFNSSDTSLTWDTPADSHADNHQSSWYLSPDFGGKGWQFIAFYPKLLTTDSNTISYTLKLLGPENGAGEVYLYEGVTVFWAPPELDDNDICEYLGTLRAQPYYLQPGMAGTFEGQPFVAHGGIGVDSSQLLTPSGAVSLPTKNLPLGDAGMTFQGYIPVLPLNRPLPGDMGASGASHAHGYAPDPGSTPGTTKYLREDATWQVPPDNGITQLTGDVVAGPGSGSQASVAIRQLHFYGVYNPAAASGWLFTSNASAVSATAIEWPLGIAASTWSIKAVVTSNTLTSGGGQTTDFQVSMNGTNLGGVTISNGTTGVFSNTGSTGGGSTSDTYGVNSGAFGAAPSGAITLTITVTLYP